MSAEPKKTAEQLLAELNAADAMVTPFHAIKAKATPPPAKADVAAIDARMPKRRRRKAVTRRFDAIKEEPLLTVYPGLLWAGKHTTIGGDPGLAKSVLSLDIAARLTRGGKVSPYSAEDFEPRVVILGSAEDGAADTIKPRLRVAGADMTKVYDLAGVLGLEGNREHLNIGEHLEALDDLLAELKPGLLVLDPISSFLGKIDSHQQSQVRGTIDPLKDILERHKSALLSIQHLNKNEKASAMYRMSGSLSLVGAPRAAFMFMRDDTQGGKSDRWLLPIKVNLQREEPGYAVRIVDKDGQPFLEWSTERVERDVNRALNPPPATKTGQAEELLRGALTLGALSAAGIADICKKNNIGDSTRRIALDNIGARSTRVGGAAGTGHWMVSLPPELVRDNEGWVDA